MISIEFRIENELVVSISTTLCNTRPSRNSKYNIYFECYECLPAVTVLLAHPVAYFRINMK